MLLVIDLNFSHTLAFVFVAGKYGAIDPIYYFLQFFMAVINDFLMVLFDRKFLFSLEFELVCLHEMREDVARLEFLFVVIFGVLLFGLTLIMVKVESNGQTMTMDILAIIFMNVTEHAYGV